MKLTLRKNVLTDGSETFDLLINDGKNEVELNLVTDDEGMARVLAHQMKGSINFAIGAIDSIPLEFITR